jgi:hypothetical protein
VLLLYEVSVIHQDLKGKQGRNQDMLLLPLLWFCLVCLLYIKIITKQGRNLKHIILSSLLCDIVMMDQDLIIKMEAES